MKIVVLVKQVPDTWEPRALDLATGLLDRGASEAILDEINERAVEIARIYAASDDENSWWGFVVFAGSLLVMAVAWVRARPLFVRPIASPTGNVTH